MMFATNLGDVSRFIRGITFKPDDICENFAKDSVVCMRTKNVQAELDLDDLISVPEAFARRDEQMLDQGDLLISSANSWNLVGKASWVPDLDFPATAGGFISILRCDRSKVDPRFFYHWVTAGKTQHELRHCGRQTTNISNLDFGRAEELEFPVPVKNGKPDLDEQKRIAGILDKADAIRRKRQQARRLTDDFLRSVFLDLFGDPVTNPKGWDVHDLNSVIGKSFRNGLSPSSKGTVAGKVLTLTAITTGAFSPEHAREAFFDRKPSVNQLVTVDTFLICRGNGNKNMVGIGVFPGADMAQVAFPDTMIACTIDRSIIEADYLQALWSTTHVRKQIEAGARTTNGTYKVNQTVLGGISFPLPPLSLQTKFSRIAKSIRSRSLKADLAKGSSDELFASLQQRAFIGEL